MCAHCIYILVSSQAKNQRPMRIQVVLKNCLILLESNMAYNPPPYLDYYGLSIYYMFTQAGLDR